MGGVGREIEMPAAALGIETPGNRDRFDQRRFSRTILADYEGHLRMEFETGKTLNGRKRKRVRSSIRNAIPKDLGSEEVMLSLKRFHGRDQTTSPTALSMNFWRRTIDVYRCRHRSPALSNDFHCGNLSLDKNVTREVSAQWRANV